MSDPRFLTIGSAHLATMLGAKPVEFTEAGTPVALTPQRPTILLRVETPLEQTWWFWDVHRKIIDEGVGG